MTGVEAYEFGDFRVDLGRMALLRKGEAIPLEPKAYDVLMVLLEGRERVVTKDELLDAVWKDTFVTPNALAQAIVQLRKALGDDAQAARYVETVARRGYRFIAPVTPKSAQSAVSANGKGQISRFSADLPAERTQEPMTVPVSAPEMVTVPISRRGRSIAMALGAAVVLIAVAGLVWQRRPVLPVSVHVGAADLSLRRLTTRAGFNAMPSWSPDGRSVAYVSDQTGNLEIYVKPLTPGSNQVAITADGGPNLQPEWSPDGQWLAYHSRKRGGIWIVPSSGGVARQVADFGSDPAWSPDSTRLAFTSDAGGLVSQSELWIVRRDGSERRPLTRMGNPVGGHRAPAWSPDGRFVAFTVGRGGWDGDVWMVSVADGRTQKIAAGEAAADPCFDPQGRWLYWGGSDPGGDSRVYRVALDHSTGAAAGAPEPVGAPISGYLTGLTIARDGTAALGMTTDTGNLWAVDIGTDGAAGEPVQLTNDVVRNAYPDYSHDGRIAFIQIVPGRPATTWIMNQDGSAREPLVPDVETTSPQWDASGKRLFVLRWPISASWVDVTTRAVTPIPIKLDDARGLRLAPDGKRVAFYTIEPSGAMNVFTRGLDGSPAAQLTFDREAVSYPAWSPDGRYLAVEVKRGDSTHVGIVPAAGGPMQTLVDARGQSWPHSWSPDGERVAFAGERNGVWNVWAVSRVTRQARQLTHFTSAAGYVRYPAWSPDGRRIVFERQTPSAGVWTLQLR
ncbi:MAG: winged helix-turn-helix domain-containing protein [Acidobacteriota bacterium]